MKRILRVLLYLGALIFQIMIGVAILSFVAPIFNIIQFILLAICGICHGFVLSEILQLIEKNREKKK